MSSSCRHPVRRASACAALLFLAACGTPGPERGEPDAVPTTAVTIPEVRDESMGDGASDAGRAPAPSVAEGAAVATQVTVQSAGIAAPGAGPNTVAGDMLIRTGAVRIEVDSLDRAIAAVHAIAERAGATIGTSSRTTGADDVRSAEIELRVPAARFDDAMRGLDPVGRVEMATSAAQDVGEEYVDIAARVGNARRLEARLLDLLAQRTGKLADVLAVEHELARIREEIDRHEGRLRWLRTRVATSTITVTLHEPAPIVARAPGESVLGEAALDAWRLFVRSLALLITASGLLVPIGAIGAAILVLRARLRRRVVAVTAT